MKVLLENRKESNIREEENMKIRKIIFTITLSLFVINSVNAETNGYLSFKFLKGQSQSNVFGGTFQEAQLGLIFSGEIAPKIAYIAEVKLQDRTRVEMNQALVKVSPSHAFNLKMGLYLVPFGKYNQFNRPHQTVLIIPPMNVEELFPPCWRDIGILLEGRASSFFYSLYLGNGLAESQCLDGGQQFKDNNANKGGGGRIAWIVDQGFEVAYSYYRGKFDSDNSRNLFLQGLDLTWGTEDFQILSEYTKVNIENPAGFSKGTAEGYFVQLSVNLGNIQPVVSYQRLEYNDEFHGTGFFGSDNPGIGISENKSRWAVGMAYFMLDNLRLKLEYDFNREKEFEKNDNIFLCQVALSF